MKQGEIWNANLNPTEGSEQAGFRPVLILSGNLMNTYSPVVICCPLTTKIKNYKGDLILDPTTQNGLIKKSEVLAIHIRSLSKSRLIERLGFVNKDQLSQMHQTMEDLFRY